MVRSCKNWFSPVHFMVILKWVSMIDQWKYDQFSIIFGPVNSKYFSPSLFKPETLVFKCLCSKWQATVLSHLLHSIQYISFFPNPGTFFQGLYPCLFLFIFIIFPPNSLSLKLQKIDVLFQLCPLVSSM